MNFTYTAIEGLEQAYVNADVKLVDQRTLVEALNGVPLKPVYVTFINSVTVLVGGSYYAALRAAVLGFTANCPLSGGPSGVGDPELKLALSQSYGFPIIFYSTEGAWNVDPSVASVATNDHTLILECLKHGRSLASEKPYLKFRPEPTPTQAKARKEPEPAVSQMQEVQIGQTKWIVDPVAFMQGTDTFDTASFLETVPPNALGAEKTPAMVLEELTRAVSARGYKTSARRIGALVAATRYNPALVPGFTATESSQPAARSFLRSTKPAAVAAAKVPSSSTPVQGAQQFQIV
jgi:hypothetical protein